MGELEAVVRKMMTAYDELDGGTIIGLSSPEIQAVDEISRKWLRGVGALKDYFNSVPAEISDVRSTLSDISETSWGDVGLVTFWLEQDYKMAGQAQHVSSPTTCVLHKEEGTWRAVLFHTVPLPEESN
jgi:ketosteroid isomerase-like protein